MFVVYVFLVILLFFKYGFCFFLHCVYYVHDVYNKLINNYVYQYCVHDEMNLLFLCPPNIATIAVRLCVHTATCCFQSEFHCSVSERCTQ